MAKQTKQQNNISSVENLRRRVPSCLLGRNRNGASPSSLDGMEKNKMDENIKQELKLSNDMKALAAEHGKEFARKRFKKVVHEQFEKAKKGETISLTSLFCAKEALE